MKWTTVSTVVSVTVGLIQTTALSRLLQPQDFGLMAMVAVVQGFLLLFADMGVSNAIILHQDATHEQLSVLYWLNLGMGLVLFAMVIASTPLLVAFYHEPRIAPLVPWIAVAFLITPFGQQFQALAQRELLFDRLAVIEMTAVVATASVAIILACLGQGVFALVWGGITNVSVRSALLVRLGWPSWRPGLHLRAPRLWSFLSFGLFQMGERAVLGFGNDVDYIMVGKFLGPGPLGIYRLAYELIVQPVYRLNPILTRVAWPVFAKRQNDNAALRSAYLEMMRIIAFVLFPSVAGLAIVAPVLVPTVFGVKWLQAVPLIQILTGMALIRSMWNPAGSILLAKGRADLGFYVNTVVAVVTTASFWTVARWGLRAVAWTWVVIMVAYAVSTWKVVFYDTIGLHYTEFLRTIGRPALMSGIMGAAVYIVFTMLRPALPGLVVLIVVVLFGAAFYGALVLLLERSYVTELWRMAFARPVTEAQVSR